MAQEEDPEGEGLSFFGDMNLSRPSDLSKALMLLSGSDFDAKKFEALKDFMKGSNFENFLKIKGQLSGQISVSREYSSVKRGLPNLELGKIKASMEKMKAEKVSRPRAKKSMLRELEAKNKKSQEAIESLHEENSYLKEKFINDLWGKIEGDNEFKLEIQKGNFYQKIFENLESLCEVESGKGSNEFDGKLLREIRVSFIAMFSEILVSLRDSSMTQDELSEIITENWGGFIRKIEKRLQVDKEVRFPGFLVIKEDEGTVKANLDSTFARYLDGDK